MNPALLLPANNGTYELTRLNQAFDPKIGCSDGIRFGLSAHAQTRDSRFGGHGVQGGFEAGHFSSVLVAAKDAASAHTLLLQGDKATHNLIKSGVPRALYGIGALPLQYETRTIPGDKITQAPLFWHPSMEVATGAVAADFPGSIQLMIGAGIAALGRDEITNARNLVEQTIAGVR